MGIIVADGGISVSCLYEVGFVYDPNWPHLTLCI